MVYKVANKKRFITIILLLILFILLVGFCVIFYISHLGKENNVSNNVLNYNSDITDSNQVDNNLPDVNSDTNNNTNDDNNTNIEIDTENGIIDENKDEHNMTSTNGEENTEETNPIATEDNPENKDSYVYGQKVPEGEEVEDSYFDDAVFIGNSQIEGILVYKAMSNATVYAAKGIMVDTIYTKPVIKTANGDRITIMDALRKNKFGKVYIMLGANELGWAYPEEFVKKYGDVIDSIKDEQPDAIIYVNAIMPVSKTKSDSDNIYNNANVDKFNKLILEMTKEKEVYFLDSKEALGDENGNLPEDAGTDGIHLGSVYYAKWFSYLKKHTVKSIKDRRGY